MGAFDEFVAYAREHPEEVELALKAFEGRMVGHDAWELMVNGYVRRDFDALNVIHTNLFSKGEHYVYIWRHENGAPFYVGSGKGYRSRSTYARPVDFYGELMALDAVLCYIADGVSEKDARFIEHYCSFALSSAGVKLANSDGVVSRLTDKGVERKRKEYQQESAKVCVIQRRLDFLVNKKYDVPENRGEVLTRFWKEYGVMECMTRNGNYEKAMESLSREIAG
jgi:hypothetical protein